jgi:hypothetical protein
MGWGVHLLVTALTSNRKTVANAVVSIVTMSKLLGDLDSHFLFVHDFFAYDDYFSLFDLINISLLLLNDY